MKMRLRLGATLLLGLAWIAGNAPVAFAHGGGGNGGTVAMSGYIMYVGFVILGYLTMYYEIPQRLIQLLFGRR